MDTPKQSNTQALEACLAEQPDEVKLKAAPDGDVAQSPVECGSIPAALPLSTCAKNNSSCDPPRAAESPASSAYPTTSYFDGPTYPPTWVKRARCKQAANSAYFALSSILIFLFGLQLSSAPLVATALVYAGLAVLAYFLLHYHSAHTSTVDELPVWVRKSLRAGVMIVPLVVVGGLQLGDASKNLPFGAGSNYVQSELDQGIRLSDDGRYAEALTHFRNAVTAAPNCQEGYAHLADTYNHLYDYHNAITAAVQAVNLDPNDSEALEDEAWALNNLYRYSEALPLAQAAIRIDPENGQAFASIAEAYRGLGDFPNALKADNKHVQLHNEEAGAYEARARTLQSLGRMAEAQADRNKANQLSAKDQAVAPSESVPDVDSSGTSSN
jgi:tetratricopeptide (TPR) repeat protein